jgi:hypothetical protein
MSANRTGDTLVKLEFAGLDLWMVQHLMPSVNFVVPTKATYSDITVDGPADAPSSTMTVKSPSQCTQDGCYTQQSVTVEFSIDDMLTAEASYSQNNFRFRYLVPPVLGQLSPPIGPSEGTTLITLVGTHGSRQSGFELGSHYTCRFGSDSTGTVVEATEYPGCESTNNDPANPNEEWVGTGAKLEQGLAFDPSGCSRKIKCPAVPGDIGTSKPVSVSLNGMQYSTTQRLFTYYAQTAIPVDFGMDDYGNPITRVSYYDPTKKLERGIEPDRSPLSIKEAGTCAPFVDAATCATTGMTCAGDDDGTGNDDGSIAGDPCALNAAGDGCAVIGGDCEYTEVCHYIIQPLVELYGGCMVVLKVSWCGIGGRRRLLHAECRRD